MGEVGTLGVGGVVAEWVGVGLRSWTPECDLRLTLQPLYGTVSSSVKRGQ